MQGSWRFTPIYKIIYENKKKQPHYTVLPNFLYHMLIYKVTIHKDAGGFMKPCKS